MVRRLVTTAATIAMAAAMIGWLSLAPGVPRATAQTAGPVVPVTAGTVAVEDVAVFLHGIGTVQAYNSVAVKSRVDGQIVRIAFTEGQKVAEGDLLVEIDPRPFQVQLANAQGQMARDRAQLDVAKRTLASRQK